MRLARSLLLDAPGEPGSLTVYIKQLLLAVLHSRSIFDCRQFKTTLRTIIGKQKKENGESYMILQSVISIVIHANYFIKYIPKFALGYCKVSYNLYII